MAAEWNVQATNLFIQTTPGNYVNTIQENNLENKSLLNL